MYIDSNRDIYFSKKRDARAAYNHMSNFHIKGEFFEYLERTSNSVMIFHGHEMRFNEPVISRGEYVHRWSGRYKKRLLARFYKLDAWFRENSCDTTLMTLTTVHRGSLPDQYTLLLNHYRKLRDAMRRPHFLGKFTYFYVLEPHQDGYIHLHMLIFQELTREQQERIKSIWSERYGVGVADALDFEIKTVAGGLHSPRNYLMKYLAKTFDIDPASTDTSSAFFLFSAVAWWMGQKGTGYSRVRFWNCSRDLQPILKLDEVDGDEFYDIQWFKTEIQIPGSDDPHICWETDRPFRPWNDSDWL